MAVKSDLSKKIPDDFMVGFNISSASRLHVGNPQNLVTLAKYYSVSSIKNNLLVIYFD